MNAVQISGMSGAGKTTIAAVLARRGLAVIDADGDPLLARHVDSAGNVVGDSAVPDFAWLARRPLVQVVDAILSHTLGRSAASRARKPSDQSGRRARP